MASSFGGGGLSGSRALPGAAGKQDHDGRPRKCRSLRISGYSRLVEFWEQRNANKTQKQKENEMQRDLQSVLKVVSECIILGFHHVQQADGEIYGYCHFEDADKAEKAMRVFRQHGLHGQKLTVQFDDRSVANGRSIGTSSDHGSGRGLNDITPKASEDTDQLRVIIAQLEKMDAGQEKMSARLERVEQKMEDVKVGLQKVEEKLGGHTEDLCRRVVVARRLKKEGEVKKEKRPGGSKAAGEQSEAELKCFGEDFVKEAKLTNAMDLAVYMKKKLGDRLCRSAQQCAEDISRQLADIDVRKGFVALIEQFQFYLTTAQSAKLSDSQNFFLKELGESFATDLLKVNSGKMELKVVLVEQAKQLHLYKQLRQLIPQLLTDQREPNTKVVNLLHHGLECEQVGNDDVNKKFALVLRKLRGKNRGDNEVVSMRERKEGWIVDEGPAVRCIREDAKEELKALCKAVPMKEDPEKWDWNLVQRRQARLCKKLVGLANVDVLAEKANTLAYYCPEKFSADSLTEKLSDSNGPNRLFIMTLVCASINKLAEGMAGKGAEAAKALMKPMPKSELEFDMEGEINVETKQTTVETGEIKSSSGKTIVAAGKAQLGVATCVIAYCTELLLGLSTKVVRKGYLFVHRGTAKDREGWEADNADFDGGGSSSGSSSESEGEENKHWNWATAMKRQAAKQCRKAERAPEETTDYGMKFQKIIL